MKQSLMNTALILDDAAFRAIATAQISLSQKISLSDAYNIQSASIERRITRGEALTGFKLGFTSKAKMEQMGVHDIIWGRLTDAMDIPNNGHLDLQNFIHPRVEPEVAFRVSKKIDDILTWENVFDHFDAVAAAIEVIDSRYENFKFSLEDVIADNCSSSAYVIGEWHGAETTVSDLDISLSINESICQSGSSNAILGNPIESLIELSKMSLKYGQPIEAGKVVLAGAATSAEYIKKGDQVKATFQHLGAVQLTVD